MQGEINAPVYVKKQCTEFLEMAEGKSEKYCIHMGKLEKITKLMSIMQMPTGLRAGQSVKEATVGYQWFFYVSILCTVYRSDKNRRRYRKAVLELARKNFKTFTVAVILLLHMLLGEKFSKLYSVAPDGSLSREIKQAMEEILNASPLLRPEECPDQFFKLRINDIYCKLTQSKYRPLNYSNTRLDGKLPNVYVVDEAGALPNNYAIDAMSSGQVNIGNPLGFIISTKYPTALNAFEDEVDYAKKVLDGTIWDEELFALLYEPDDTKNWAGDESIIEQANPAGLEIPEILDNVRKLRKRAIEIPATRENFLTKHCNIIYQGVETEGYIAIEDLQKCAAEAINWQGMTVYVGVDLAMTTDNCAVAIAGLRDGVVYADVIAFIPQDKVEEKSMTEKVDYTRFIQECKCIACGEKIVDYAVIEDFVFSIEEKYGVTVAGIALDRCNALSSAQKWERGRDGGKGYNTVIVRQHSDTLHMPIKLLKELVLQGRFVYEKNGLLEINFQNARCVYDTNMNQYIHKKRSRGKVDMVMAIIDAMYLLQQIEILDGGMGWTIQVG